MHSGMGGVRAAGQGEGTRAVGRPAGRTPGRVDSLHKSLSFYGTDTARPDDYARRDHHLPPVCITSHPFRFKFRPLEACAEGCLPKDTFLPALQGEGVGGSGA